MKKSKSQERDNETSKAKMPKLWQPPKILTTGGRVGQPIDGDEPDPTEDWNEKDSD